MFWTEDAKIVEHVLRDGKNKNCCARILEWTHFDIVWRKVLEIIERNVLDSRHKLKLLSAILDIVDTVNIVARIYQREDTG